MSWIMHIIPHVNVTADMIRFFSARAIGKPDVEVLAIAGEPEAVVWREFINIEPDLDRRSVVTGDGELEVPVP
jgi:hypothetical protein